MRHHAYSIVGDHESVARAVAHIAEELGMPRVGNPDIIERTYSLFSIDDARALITILELGAVGKHGKVVIVHADKLLYQAQNALLKICEEPPPDTTIMLHVPSEGVLLPTLRSRLAQLRPEAPALAAADALIALPDARRASYITTLLDQYKSDNESIKSQARRDVQQLMESFVLWAHREFKGAKNEAMKRDMKELLKDLNAFLPLLHEGSTPLKQILNHLLLVIPKRAPKANV